MPKKIRLKPLMSDHQMLSTFKNEFQKRSKVDIPIEYYKNNEVIGAFDSNDRMVGGYVLAKGNDIRWIKLIPENSGFNLPFRLNEIIELNSLWLATNIRNSALSAYFWIAVAKDLANRPVKAITFAADSKKLGLTNLYRKISSGILYEGANLSPSISVLRVYWTNRWRFKFLKVLYARDLLARYILGKLC
ncbi:MAG: hypothetical protein ACHQ1D_03700 [Nitrososphaerales archaeon]